MNVLAVNCGSTSLKFRLVNATGTSPSEQHHIASGTVNAIGPAAQIDFTAEGGPTLQQQRAIPNLGEAVAAALDWIKQAVPGTAIDATGHRIVHGGAEDGPARIDAATIRQIEELEELAPLHNGPALEALRAVTVSLGAGVPAVATFDTTFHRTMPPRAALYALPLELMERHAIRRYGFHGLAHRSMMNAYAAATGHRLDGLRLLTLQLGGGCSIAAIDSGRSIDTSMGFTPLEGLMMGRRSGDLDPSLPGFLAERERLSGAEVEQLLNAHSGLLGVSGRSDDVRALLKAESTGDRRAALALDMFCYRVRKAIGAYLAVLGGAEAVIFGGGIGEHQPQIRARCCDGLEWCGLRLDRDRNATATGESRISDGGSAIAVYVIPSDEESVIVADTIDCLGKQ